MIPQESRGDEGRRWDGRVRGTSSAQEVEQGMTGWGHGDGRQRETSAVHLGRIAWVKDHQACGQLPQGTLGGRWGPSFGVLGSLDGFRPEVRGFGAAEGVPTDSFGAQYP